MAHQTAFNHNGYDMTVYDYDLMFNRRSFAIKHETPMGEVTINLTRAELNQLRDAIDMTLRPYDQPEEDK